MISIAPVDTLSAESALPLLHALGFARAARASIDDAAVDLIDLAADTRWRSDGVVALRESMSRLRADTRAASGDVDERIHELERVSG